MRTFTNDPKVFESIIRQLIIRGRGPLVMASWWLYETRIGEVSVGMN